MHGGASQPDCDTVNPYSLVSKWAEGITLFVECSVQLLKPLTRGGTVDIELDDGVKNDDATNAVTDCYVPNSSTLQPIPDSGMPVKC